jgi:diguanylate cyclase (GGDEF)-like protein
MSLSNPGRELVGRVPSAGDDIFRNIVAKVRERLRREDIVGRVRRDDLAILLPEIGLSGARVAAEKIRQIVLSEHPMVDGNPVKIGVSMGIACEVPQAVVAGNLYKSALQALNRAKQAGANVIST